MRENSHDNGANARCGPPTDRRGDNGRQAGTCAERHDWHPCLARSHNGFRLGWSDRHPILAASPPSGAWLPCTCGGRCQGGGASRRRGAARLHPSLAATALWPEVFSPLNGGGATFLLRDPVARPGRPPFPSPTCTVSGEVALCRTCRHKGGRPELRLTHFCPDNGRSRLQRRDLEHRPLCQAHTRA